MNAELLAISVREASDFRQRMWQVLRVVMGALLARANGFATRVSGTKPSPSAGGVETAIHSLGLEAIGGRFSSSF